MSLIRLTIDRISYSQNTNGAYALLLNEKNGERKLPIVIGGFEAQSIAVALEKEIKPPRPLTHDLFKNFSDCFEINLKQVIIHKLVDGVFYSSLICERDKIEEIIDARTSDAIALALRYNAPIFAYDSILKKAGFSAKISENFNKIKTQEDKWLENFISDKINKNDQKYDLKKLSVNKLKSLLTKLVSKEKYEKAALIRDELSKRKS